MTAPLNASRHAAARERQKVLGLCAGVILLFTFADTLALGHFSPLAFGSRVVWAAGTLTLALALPRLSEDQEAFWLVVMGAGTSLFFAWLTVLTGGFQSPLFHWILAMPLVVAVVVQNHPRATLASGVATLATGVALVYRSGSGAPLVLQWAIQALGMCALAYYASVTYRRLHVREQELQDEKVAALGRAQRFDAEVSARQHAEDAVRARDEFLAVAAHELKTPLTALALQVHSLQSEPQDPQLLPRIARVERSVDRLKRLLEELFDVARLNEKNLTLELQLEEVGLAEVARELVSRMDPQAQGAGCTLVLHAPREVMGLWDRQRLDRIFTNLLSNAVKYGGGRPIQVDIQGDDRWATLRVTDEGMGIEEKDRKRIFERFERAVSSKHYGGMGLGLWIVRQLVQALGGEVSVSSTVGQGSSFLVRLPRGGPASRSPLAHPLH